MGEWSDDIITSDVIHKSHTDPGRAAQRDRVNILIGIHLHAGSWSSQFNLVWNAEEFGSINVMSCSLSFVVCLRRVDFSHTKIVDMLCLLMYQVMFHVQPYLFQYVSYTVTDQPCVYMTRQPQPRQPQLR